jgi:hypothetical protein
LEGGVLVNIPYLSAESVWFTCFIWCLCFCSIIYSKERWWSSKVVKCFEHKKDGLQSFASHVDWIWCVQLVHSLEYAVVVISLPYISGPVMLLWEQSNWNEASDIIINISICCSQVCTFHMHVRKLLTRNSPWQAGSFWLQHGLSPGLLPHP